jgi:hypothetical protein
LGIRPCSLNVSYRVPTEILPIQSLHNSPVLQCATGLCKIVFNFDKLD